MIALRLIQPNNSDNFDIFRYSLGDPKKRGNTKFEIVTPSATVMILIAQSGNRVRLDPSGLARS